MAKLRAADFYYGAVLSNLVNKGICPMLVLDGIDRQVYKCTTHDDHFLLFLKYRSAPNNTKSVGYQSWHFVLSPNDTTELREYITQDTKLSVGLICGGKKLSDSEYAILHKNEITTILGLGKGTITISRKNPVEYHISIGRGKTQNIIINTDRIC